jgi:hypothetical protein
MRLPFAFASEHGVVFEENTSGQWVLFHRPFFLFTTLSLWGTENSSHF